MRELGVKFRLIGLLYRAVTNSTSDHAVFTFIALNLYLTSPITNSTRLKPITSLTRDGSLTSTLARITFDFAGTFAFVTNASDSK